jgi:predicted nucleotide-binding protein (sugar kinase/HSP70/actin superfamily)
MSAKTEKVRSHFKGFGISNMGYATRSFVCEHCANHCEIKQINIENEKESLFYGGICDRYEKRYDAGHKLKIPDFFSEREKLLRAGYEEVHDKNAKTIGIPRGLMNYYQMFPFWNAFFRAMGFEVVLSQPTGRDTVTASLEVMTAETCLPVEVIHGHVTDLLKKNVDYIFLPFVVNSAGSDDNPTNNCNCPWVQSHPYLIKAAFTNREVRDKFLIPSVHFRYRSVFPKELERFFKDRLRITPSFVRKADSDGLTAQGKFEKNVKLLGNEVLSNLTITAYALFCWAGLTIQVTLPLT